MTKRIKVLDKEFEVSIPSFEIQKAILSVAEKMNSELAGKKVIFLGILNGSFMFASDLFKKINFPCQITFLKIASYQGTSSTGKLKSLIGLNEDLEGYTVVVIEDIVDTGHTLDHIVKQLKGFEPAEIKIATLLYKPDAYKKDIKIDYVGIEIPNDFIIGYGLDYNGYARNLEDIYTLVKS